MMRQYIRILSVSAPMSCLLPPPPSRPVRRPRRLPSRWPPTSPDELNRTEAGKPVQTEQKAIIQGPRRADRSPGKAMPGLQERHEAKQPWQRHGRLDDRQQHGRDRHPAQLEAIPGRTGISCRAASRGRSSPIDVRGFPPEISHRARTLLPSASPRRRAARRPQAKAADETKKEGEKP